LKNLNVKNYLNRILNENEDLSTIDFQKDFLDVGKSNDNGTTEDDVDETELSMGIEIEMEHTINKELAKRIALDHLAEIPDYYTRLKKIEDEAKAERF
jgi:hypothetical protein